MTQTQQEYTEVDQSKVQEGETSNLLGGSLFSTSRTFAEQGGFDGVFAIDGVNIASRVMVSITEVNANGIPFQGAASCEVHNVHARSGGVGVRGFVGWPSNIWVRLSFIVAN